MEFVTLKYRHFFVKRFDKQKKIVSLLPIVYIMFIALILSIIGGEYVDAIAIFFIIIIDAIVGTIQEYKAGKEAESLSNLIKVRCKVLRDGKERVIDSDDLLINNILIKAYGVAKKLIKLIHKIRG